MIVEKKRSRQREWQIKKEAEGKCRICGSPHGKSKYYCDAHAKVHAINSNILQRKLKLSNYSLDDSAE